VIEYLMMTHRILDKPNAVLGGKNLDLTRREHFGELALEHEKQASLQGVAMHQSGMPGEPCDEHEFQFLGRILKKTGPMIVWCVFFFSHPRTPRVFFEESGGGFYSCLAFLKRFVTLATGQPKIFHRMLIVNLRYVTIRKENNKHLYSMEIHSELGTEERKVG